VAQILLSGYAPSISFAGDVEVQPLLGNILLNGYAPVINIESAPSDYIKKVYSFNDTGSFTVESNNVPVFKARGNTGGTYKITGMNKPQIKS
jgi:hypothetical protein